MLRVPWRLIGGFLLLLALGACRGRAVRGNTVVEGSVVDLEGRPLRGVQIAVSQWSSRSGANGSFRLRVPPQPAWLQARLPGYLPLLRPFLPGQPLQVRLTPDDGETLVIRAGGDVMAGRRFYTPEPGVSLSLIHI